jgi:hypothetical protein
MLDALCNRRDQEFREDNDSGVLVRDPQYNQQSNGSYALQPSG